ncbi:MAG: restriction endonuclease subunit S [Nitrospira sp.]|nr:restriction endonuclease subunit S [Nitrospira sp.]
MTDAIDLTKDQRKQLSDLLRRFLPGVVVWAYGSRVKWTARPNSDLDLVAFTTPAQRPHVADLKEALAESNLPFPVDIHVWDDVPERFREIIRKEFVVMQEAKELESKTSMPGEWRERPLAELTDNFDSMRLPVKDADRRPGPFPYYGASGVVDYVDNYLFDGEYLLVAEDGENLRTRKTPVAFIARGKFWVNNHVHVVRGNSESDTRFLMYALSSADISGYLTGSTMPKLTQGNLNSIPLLTPPLPEQRAIAHILGTLDDKIELNRRMNETLEAMARALFKSWFIDFDPVRAKAEGRDPGLPKHVADLFPDSFEDSELGEIPRGWRGGRSGEVVDHLRDQENPLMSPDELFHHFSIPAFDEGQTPKLEYGESIKSLKMRVPAGVVLLSKLNPEIERVWLVDVGSADRAVCSTEFLVLNPRPPFTRSFVYCLMRSPFFRQQIEGLVTGTSKSHQRAQVESILNLPVVIPPSSIVATFDRTSESLLARTLECRRESRTLSTLRDALLPKLISGEIRLEKYARTQ